MGKRLIFVLVLAIVLGVSCSAFASVQNVKVSGDITATGVVRNNFDLTKTPSNSARPVTHQNYDDKERDWLSITRVRVDADLTDNVSATVRLLNERNWNGESTTGYSSNRNIAGTGSFGGDNNKELQVDLDLAYVTLKEFLYSPLTISVGRQELHFGNDWLIGDPDTNVWSGKTSLAEGDMSARKSFDAIRATLDYNPLVIDAMYAKIAENNVTVNDDTTLYGVNAAYAMDKNTNLEGFFYAKVTGAKTAPVTHTDGTAGAPWLAGVKQKADEVYTVGGRVTNKTVKNLSVDLQSAFQFGTYNPKYDVNAVANADTANRRAWGLEAMVDYDLKDVAMISKYAPSVSAAYVYLSGNKGGRNGTSTYKGWDPMFENQTFGHIANAIFGFTDQSIVGLSGKMKPVQDVGVKVDCFGYWFAKKNPEGSIGNVSLVNGARNFTLGKTPFLGQEYDVTVSYDYTEDVQFSLLGGVFVPGKSIKSAYNEQDGTTALQRATATELIGSMKVTF